MKLDKPGRGLELGSRERVEGVRCRLGWHRREHGEIGEEQGSGRNSAKSEDG